jgi:PBP1b-binding outer membrane lipoprotein LpoB
MTKEEFMHLQHSESVVAQMAATVFAGLVQKQEITLAHEDALVERAVAIAIKLAVRTEKLVKSDQEWVKKDASSLPVIG